MNEGLTDCHSTEAPFSFFSHDFGLALAALPQNPLHAVKQKKSCLFFASSSPSFSLGGSPAIPLQGSCRMLLPPWSPSQLLCPTEQVHLYIPRPGPVRVILGAPSQAKLLEVQRSLHFCAICTLYAETCLSSFEFLGYHFCEEPILHTWGNSDEL